ncbi:protein phosphatase 2A regulatory subunit cdc55 [Podila minutissima]|uniref:Protein phosphatase PP2A regulatory subunit B n=1 Tax=Podila minutissima TaxID=64525 RepID=A0A9P5SLA5_9FUNG|nr:protein phosphatase 2A regulatory subunit cdc55 [Podila minutissima]
MTSEGENSWKFAQCFGDKGEVEDITEADIISTVEFDHTGDYLATGDKGGRVVLFERNEGKKGCEYKFHTEFQSHEPEFDYLKSLEIEEKINKIKWCKRQNSAHFLLSTNDKTVKLWKVFEKSIKVVAENNHSSGQRVPNGSLQLPKLAHHDSIVAAVPRKVYANAHAYHINSISINSDAETYISADDLRINLWNLDISDQSFNIVDIKPVNMEELTEVITAAEFHPMHCNLFMYSSSKGTIKLSDMRESALCDQHSKLFEEEEDPSNKSFFSEIISSISDVKFSKDGRYILSRDYLTLKVWDINMESRPVQTINIHDHLRNKLCDLYENDCIFDKFECTFSGDGKNVLTGSYNNNFHIFDRNGTNDVTLQADKSAFKAKRVGSAKNKMAARPGFKNGKKDDINVESIDFSKKILHASWHPNENSIAVAATNNLFIFTSSAIESTALMVAKFSELTPDKVTRLKDVLKQGMLNRQENEILEILYGTDTTRHYSLSVHLMDLVDTSSDTELGSGVWWPLLSKSPHKVLPLMDAALQEAQKELLKRSDVATNNERWRGEKQDMFFKPKCSVRVNGQLPKGCRDYQEIKIQEQTTKLAMGTIPRSMFVILHDDLVDYAKSGDDVTITGTVIRRWKPPMPGDRCDIELAILANHVFIYNEQRVGVGVTEEQRLMFEQFWLKYRPPISHDNEPAKPFTARNIILSQVCPQVYGLYIVKLAVMLVLTGGVQKVDKSGLKVRGEPHLLLVGDPGTGKSQFLKFATQLNPRSILTTGIGTSSAGLTVTAVKDGNEWLLEAGALVLADRGLCCIDEFGGMREHDKTAIHEAMEQQSISIAKAGIVCKLNTRCSVIAATNPKGKYDPEQSVSINIALASPLLSRFDLVLVLMDTGNLNWDRKISSFILNSKMMADQDDPHRAMSRSQRSRRKRRMLNRIQTFTEREGNGEASTGGRRRVMGDDGSPELTDESNSDEDDVGQDPEGPWSIGKLKAYLIWVRATFEPRLTPPAEEVLTKYYQLQRKADVRNAARTTIRLLESLIRLSQAHARLMAKDLVTVEDAVAIVSLMEATVQGGVAVLGGVNPLHASFPKSAEDEYQMQETVLLRRLDLEHLASTPRAQRSQERRNEANDEWIHDVKEEVLSPVGPNSGRLVDVDQFRMPGSKRRRSPQPGTSSTNNGYGIKPGTRNAFLDDDDEEEMLQQFRQDDMLPGCIEEEDTYEEPLFDRRADRRNAPPPGWKGKEVDRGPGRVEQPTTCTSHRIEDDDDDDDLYGFRPPGSGSVEI